MPRRPELKAKAKLRPKSYNDKCEQLAFRRRARVYARRFYRIGFIAAVFFIGTFAFWLFNSDSSKTYVQSISDNIFNLTAKTGLKLEHVDFVGLNYTGKEDLAMQLNLGVNRPILGLNLEDLRTQIKKENWVKDAQVQRVLPSNLKITIEERKPIAIWQLGKKYSLIDSDGVVLQDVDSPDVLPFPLIIGPGANKEAANIFATLAHEKRLYEQVQSAALMGERRWNILFNNGIEVMLPANNMEQAWSHLAEMDQSEHILSRQIKSIDMRMADRIYIKPLENDTVENLDAGARARNGTSFTFGNYWRTRYRHDENRLLHRPDYAG